MLDIMRQRKGLVRIILGAVVISVAASFAFALYGVWGGALSGAVQGAPEWIATVDGYQIPTRLFNRQRGMLLQEFRDRLAGQNVSDETLTTLVDQQALGLLLGTHLAQKEATRAGLQVTPQEISDAIVSSPGFQRGGRFIGMQQYRRQLASFGMQPAQFEREVSSELAADKLRMAIFALATVDETDVDRRYRDEVERVDVSYVLLSDTTFADARPPSEPELRAHFTSHASAYMTPEARRAAYVLFDREAKASSMTIPEDELKGYYEKNQATLYSHKDQRRASHILFRLAPDADPAKESEIRAKATQVLGRIRAGEDFAKLARENSEDPGSASAGGDLGFFERGRMVKEFEDPAFSLSVGAVSDVVKSPFGYHIIKVTESRPAGVQPFEEVREEIRRTLAVQRAQEQIRKDAEEFTRKLGQQEASFDKTAASSGYTLQDTGLFAKGEPAGTLGRLPQMDEAVFAVQAGGISPAVAVPQGLAIFALAEIRQPQPAPFESVRARVETDLKQSRAREKARSTAAEILAASGPLANRVTKQKLEVKTFPKVNRIQPLPPLTDTSKAAAFAATPGSVLGPFDSDDGLVILEVTGKSPVTPEEAAGERTALRRKILGEERTTLYQAFLARLQKNSKIDINEALLSQGRGARG